MRQVISLGFLALAIAGCDRAGSTDRAPKAKTTKAGLEQMRSECASQLTYARLKEYVFDEAARIRNSDPRRLDRLAAYSVVRMDDPVVKSRDDQLNVTVCTGQFVLNLPPGIQDAFDGQPVIQADVEYAAQAAADGSGLVYSMTGAEPIIYRLATLGLSALPGPPITPAAVAEVEKEAPEIVAAEPRPKLQPAVPAVTNARKATAKAPEVAAARVPEPLPSSKVGGSPSFKCRHAKTPSEKMVCGSGSLAAADRRMSAVYYGEMAGASSQAKRTLRQTRDTFLARRERCSSESCVARVYAERVAEIRRIGGN